MTKSRLTALAAAGTAAFALLTTGLAPAAAASDPAMTIALSGGHEVPGPGDLDGSGTARLRFVPASNQICFDLDVRGIAPATMAHIHPGDAGDAGSPPLVMLAPPASGRSEGCVAVAPAVLARITANPGAFFVNIHNSEFPGGALRGQLQP
jgi:hypothetical protein